MNKSERSYLFYLLSKQEYSKDQLRQKLLTRNNISSSDIDELIAEFSQEGWQSDQRYIKGLLSRCLAKYYGLARVKQKILYEKKMSKALLNAELNLLEVDWFELARACYLKKYVDKPVADHKDKQKRLQYLLRYGHTLEAAQYAIKGE